MRKVRFNSRKLSHGGIFFDTAVLTLLTLGKSHFGLTIVFFSQRRPVEQVRLHALHALVGRDKGNGLKYKTPFAGVLQNTDSFYSNAIISW